MCLILFAYRPNADFKLVLAANRDEYFARETATLTFWDDAPHILAGRDLEKGGAWLGIDQRGRFAAVTNYREAKREKQNRVSRGLLISNYLRGTDSPWTYLDSLQITANQYDGFNLLIGDEHSLFYFSSKEKKTTQLRPGVYGLSNHRLDTPWPKVKRGKRLLQTALEHNPLATDQLLEVLSDRHRPTDDKLPDTGVGKDWERLLAPIFITSEHYGTRCSSVLLITNDNSITMTEKTYWANQDHSTTSCTYPPKRL